MKTQKTKIAELSLSLTTIVMAVGAHYLAPTARAGSNA